MFEYDFTRIWKGVNKKVDMDKVMKYKTKEGQLKKFRQELEKLQQPAKNLSKMQTGNLSELYSISLINEERTLKERIEKIKGKKLLSTADRKNLRKYENLKRIKEETEDREITQARKIVRKIETEELITRKIEVSRKVSEKKKKGRGRKPTKRKKQINVFTKKKTVQGKTKPFDSWGEISTKKGNFWIISPVNKETGAFRARDKETGRFTKP